MITQFHGTRQPKTVLQQEQPWMRAAAFLFAAGSSMREVAEATEKSVPTVSNLLRQPWFQQLVTELMEAHGKRDIMDLFKSEQFNSFATILEVRDNLELSPTVRLKAAQDILDRGLGRAVQRVETTRGVSSGDPHMEEARLTQELAQLQQEQTRLRLW